MKNVKRLLVFCVILILSINIAHAYDPEEPEPVSLIKPTCDIAYRLDLQEKS